MKTIKKIPLLLLTFVMTLGVFNITTKAEEIGNVSLVSTGYNYQWSAPNTLNGMISGYAELDKIYVDGLLATCFDPTTDAYGGSGYNSQEMPDNQILKEISRIAVANDYQNFNDTEYAAWQVYQHSKMYADSGYTPTSVTPYIDFNAYAQQFEDVATSFWLAPDFNFGDGIIKAGETKTFEKTTAFYNWSIDYLSNNVSAYLDSNNDLVVTNNNTTDETLTIELKKDIGNYQGLPMVYNKPGSQQLGVHRVKDPDFVSFDLTNEKKGSFELTKKDNKGNYIPNVRYLFSVNADMSDPFYDIRTNENGVITIPNLEPGVIYYQEQETAENLVLNTTIEAETINAGDVASVNKVNNWKQARASISKVDTKGQLINAPAVFGVYAPDGSFIERLTTVNGIATTSLLDYGNGYSFVEEQAPEGYVKNAEPTYFNITENEVTVGSEKENKQIQGYGQVAKVDTKGNIIKAPSIFEVYNSKGQLLETITTTNGIAKTKLMDYSVDNYFVEKQAPNMFIKNTDKIYFDITEEGVTVKFNKKNERATGKIELIKEDRETGKDPQGEANMVGVGFTLFANVDFYDPTDPSKIIVAKGTNLGQKIMGEDLKLTWDNLYLSDKDNAYKIVETKLPLGYEKADDIFVTLKYKNDTTPVITSNKTVKEDVIKNKFKITKVVGTNTSGVQQFEQGAEFKVQLERDILEVGLNKAKVYDTLITDKNGEAESKLLPFAGILGYRVTQTKAGNENLELAPSFIVKVDSSTVPTKHYVINNQLFTAYPKFEKFLTNTGETITLNSAKVKIWDKQTNGYYFEQVGKHRVNEWTTDEDGSVMTNREMPAGKYDLIEIDGPEGTNLRGESLPFEITSSKVHEINQDGKAIQIIRFGNDAPVGKIIINKNHEDYDTVEPKSAGFKVWNSGLEAIISPATGKTILEPGQQWTNPSTEDGLWYTEDGKLEVAELPMSLGNVQYSVQEIVTNVEYDVDNKVYTFDFVKEGDTTLVYEGTVDIENKLKRTDLEITKYNNYTKEVVLGEDTEGIEFTLFADEGYKDIIGTAKLDKETGKAIFKDIVYGTTGYLKETSTNPKFLESDNILKIVFDKDLEGIGLVHKEDFGNEIKKTDLEITKYNNYTKEVVLGEDTEGIEFTLFADEGYKDIIGTAKLDKETGKAIFKDIVYGTTGYLKETSTNPKFIDSDKVLKIVFDKDLEGIGFVHKVDFENEIKRTDLELTKTNEYTGKVITGVKDFEFTLYADEELTDVIATAKINELTGKLVFKDIVYGTTAYLKETGTDEENYYLSDKVMKIVFDNKLEGIGKTHKVTFANKPVPKIGTMATGVDGIKELDPTVDNPVQDDISFVDVDITRTYVVQTLAVSDFVVPAIEKETGKVYESLTEKEMQKALAKVLKEQPEYIKVNEVQKGVKYKERTGVHTFNSVIKANTLKDGEGLVFFEWLFDEANYKPAEPGFPGEPNIPVVKHVNPKDPGQTIKMKNKEYEIQVNKVDSSTNKAIVNNKFVFTFKAYKDGELVKEVDINGDENTGIATFKFTGEGSFDKFDIIEKDAPDGYVLSKEVKEVTMKDFDENNIYSFVYNNDLMPRRVVTGIDTQNTIILGVSLVGAGIMIVLVIKNKKKRK